MEEVETQPCSGKPSLRLVPQWVFCLVRRIPCSKSLSGYGGARGSGRKSQRWIPHTRCRPGCTSPTTFWLGARAHRRCMREQWFACFVSGGSSPSGCTAGSGTVQDGAKCRKASKVAQLAVRQPQYGRLRLAPQCWKVPRGTAVPLGRSLSKPSLGSHLQC